jgi:nucleoid-associated protein YgaU
VISDAENAIQRAENNEIVTTYAKDELNEAVVTLAKARSEKEKIDDPDFVAKADDESAGILLAAETYAQSMRYANDSLDSANDAVRVALEREREFYRRKAVNTMDEAEKLINEIQRLKEQGLIKQLMIPAPVVPETTNDSVQDVSTLSNEEKVQAALDALNRAKEKYGDEDYQSTIADAEEAIRIAKMVQKSDGSTVGPQQQQQQSKGDSKTYTVRLIPDARDCLWRIASYPDIYGNASLWPKIWEANRDQIPDPDVIQPGQVLVIPPPAPGAVR